jgi:UDP-N-acetylmuramoyl-L-alanyl-D-glutamate--2,6-diaminopimelate ligase
VKNPILYGVDKGGLQAKDVVLTPSGSTYRASAGSDIYHITCHLPGSFNVYNSLAAVGAGRALGLTRQQIESGIASLKSVEGRMTYIDEGQNFTVIVIHMTD